jgi:pimeloyl-ACP methyl ester carboxylesterase
MNRSVCVLALLLAGCGGIGVRPTSAPGPFDSWRLSAAGDTISARTLQTLRAWDLDQNYPRDMFGTFRRLQELAEKDPQPDLVFALAELSYLLGRDAEKCDTCNAIPFYYLCAGYAYHYLYCPGGATQVVRASGGLARFDPRASPFDPRFRVACDLYNAGLAKCIRAAQQVGRLDSRQALQIPTKDGQAFTLSVAHHGFSWKPEEFGPLLLSEDYRTEGLQNQYRTYGLGVPLIGSRVAPQSDPGQGLYPPGVCFPVTAFFRFEGNLADLRGQHAGRLELYNPLTVQAIDVGGVTTPLETDLTTPLAYFLERASLEKYGFEGFLRPDKVKSQAGVYLVEPYQPGKIPVLLVHGILSSPLTWAPMYNDLLADPRIREHYQFWFYLYPTANPYIVSAADLRDNLHNLRQRIDPQHKDAALENMVVVGHSMGGLVSHLLTTDSGDDFWHLVSERPIDELQTQQATKDELHRVFYFQRQSYVKRVVFLGTPHHGSQFSPSLPGRVLKYFVRLPQNLVFVATDLARADPGALGNLKPESVPTSLDQLKPGTPALELLSMRPKPEGVHFHSVVGLAPATKFVRLERLMSGANMHEKGDGVVPYTSAHIADVDSELVIPAEHTEVQSHPLAVQEVRRILLEHLQSR